MRWLSRDISHLVSQPATDIFDVLVVGSGYGGAMAAATLAGGTVPAKDGAPERPVKLCVLERGEEYLPGQFPSQMAELAGHVRAAMPQNPEGMGNAQGLFDLRIGPDVFALVANGLGGGSLINAAVMLEPDFKTFTSRMPADVETELETTYFAEAKDLLGATRTPPGQAKQDNTVELHATMGEHPLKKTALLKSLAPQQFHFAPLTVEMQGADNKEGVALNACTLCGDCMTGCNVGARESLDTNLLVKARKLGAEIYTGASVLKIRRVPGDPLHSPEGLWELEVVYTNRSLRQRQEKPLKLRTHKLILAAGTFGSTEILMRSEPENLHFSDRLGTQFSCNGDNLAAIYKAREEANSVAEETQPLAGDSDNPRHVGPTITGFLKVPASESQAGFLVQEFSTPAPLKRLFEELVTTTDLLQSLSRKDSTHHVSDHPAHDPLAVSDLAIRHSCVVGLIGHDQADGILRWPGTGTRTMEPRLEKRKPYEGQLQVQWPQASKGKALQDAFDQLKHVATPQLQKHGRVLPNPLWQPLPDGLEGLLDKAKGPVLTVHPLGGCPMGQDIASGVVNGYGMVFQAAAKAETTAQKESDAENQDSRASIWEGSLLVLDGAMVPGSLGANPSLTIAALSLRAAKYWRKAWGWNTASAANSTSGTASVAEAAPAVNDPLVFPRPIFRPPQDCTSSERTKTQLQIIERLHGPVGNGLYAEITCGFAPQSIQALTQPLQRRLALDPGLKAEMPMVNRLRIFEAATWARESLNCAHDAQREEFAVVTADLDGHMDLLVREKSCPVTRQLLAFFAFFCNRGVRDAARGLRNREMAEHNALHSLRLAIRLASRAGEVRRFDYIMRITSIQAQAGFEGLLAAGDAIHGVKRFTYSRRSNPWNQLLYLTLNRFPLNKGLFAQKPQLKLDDRFLARQGVPLLRITAQHNQPEALADMARFGMLAARLFLSIHLWSFRKPDAPYSKPPQRLPGPLKGLPPPEVGEIELHHTAPECSIPVHVRLTRYPRRDSALPPLVFIHGFSASGTSFAHPALSPSMASYFWHRGRDIWILDLRTSAGMPTAIYPWAFEDMAWADIPVAIAHIVAQVERERACAPGTIQVDIFAHCIGAVMLSMALLTDPPEDEDKEKAPVEIQNLHYQDELKALPGRIHRVVLSQKSFALSYSDANVLRAYLMRFLRRLVLPERYRFRPSPFPSMQDTLTDMFLSSLPYPADEYDRDNPPWYRPLERTPWLSTRHRMDALYEHTFNVNNMSDEVLLAIDDQFGPINTETIAQIIHFAKHQLIATREGHNIFVSDDNLQARWPKGGTLGLHNAENRMVDANTLKLTEKWMLRTQTPYLKKSIPRAAHQDGLIGLHSKETFQAVDEFLCLSTQQLAERQKQQDRTTDLLQETVRATAAPEKAAGTSNGSGVLTKPWIGPRVQHTRAGIIQLLVGTHPAHANSKALVIPVKRAGTGYRPASPPGSTYPVVDLTLGTGWEPLDLAGMVKPVDLNCADGVLVMVAASMEVTDFFVPAIQTNHAWQLLNRQQELQRLSLLAIPADLVWKLLGQCLPEVLADAFIPASVWRKPTTQVETALTPTSLAFASCQYPAGVLDKSLAEASYHRLAQRLAPDAPNQPSALLLLGDQIYADATAGLLDPSRETDRYQRPYEDLFQIPGLRRLIREIPVYMMPDDHEVCDNWEPGLGAQKNAWKEQGVSAYLDYQRSEFSCPAHLWHIPEIDGIAVFMADTRYDRVERLLKNPGAGAAGIMGADQTNALEAWLLQCHHSPEQALQPKWISSASMVLPRRLGSSAGRPAHLEDCFHHDGWDGYPASRSRLLGFIAHHQIQGVVFISGDEHLASITEATVGSVKVVNIHAPALYAPFPFANAKPAHFAAHERFTVDHAGHHYDCEVRTEFAPAEDGFVVVTPHRDQESWFLEIEIQGRQAQPWVRKVKL